MGSLLADLSFFLKIAPFPGVSKFHKKERSFFSEAAVFLKIHRIVL